jgi:hypothetical protein
VHTFGDETVIEKLTEFNRGEDAFLFTRVLLNIIFCPFSLSQLEFFARRAFSSSVSSELPPTFDPRLPPLFGSGDLFANNQRPIEPSHLIFASISSG